MKKLLLCAAAIAVAISAGAWTPATETTPQLGTPHNAKQAPAGLLVKRAEAKAHRAGAKKKVNAPASVASDLMGGYTWTCNVAQDLNEATQSTEKNNVVIYDADDNTGTFKIAGMFDAPVTARFEAGSGGWLPIFSSESTFTIDQDQAVVYTSKYGKCKVMGLFYYEGDEEYPADWYYTDIDGTVNDDGTLSFDEEVWFYRVILEGEFADYYLTPVWMPGSAMAPNSEVN